MALAITNKCVNCGICETECPNHAIYPPAEQWNFANGNSRDGNMILADGTTVDAWEMQSPRSLEYFYIVKEKCTECEGFHKSPRCASVCPENCCLPLKE